MKFAVRLFAVVSLAGYSTAAYAAGGHNHHHHHGDTEQARDGLTLGGFINSQAAVADQDLDAGLQGHNFSNNTEIHLNFRNTAEQGYAYGAVVEMEGDVTADARDEGLNSDKTYLFFESNRGRLEAGNNTDAGAMLGINGGTVARGTGGVHGDWMLYAVAPGGGGHHGGDYITMPSLPLHHQHGITEDATKLTYLSPQWNGFRAGISYIPDTGNGGQTLTGRTGHREYADAVNAGLRFDNEVGKVKYAISLTGESGQEEVPGHEDLKAFSVGTSVEFCHFAISGNYGNWSETLNHAGENPEGAFGSLGLAYTMDNAGVSVSYLTSTYNENEFDNLVFSADYTPFAGFTPYAEISLFNFNPDDVTLAENNGTLFLTGALLQF